MWSDNVLLWLFRKFPPSDPIFKAPAGRAEMEYEDEVKNPFFRWLGLLPEQLLNGRSVLDLGCGFGGRAVRFFELGAESVVGLEVDDEKISQARMFSTRKGVQRDVTFVLGVGENAPFPDAQFDLVTMYDVMEHVISPRDVLSECYRILRPGGLLALVFPPYYELSGGSHMHGFASSFPGLNLLFSTRALRSASLIAFERDGIDHRPYLREVPTDKLWNMNGLTVRGFQRLLRDSTFHALKIRYIARHDRRMTRKTGRQLLVRQPAFWLFEAAARLPLMRELFCSRVCALLQR